MKNLRNLRTSSGISLKEFGKNFGLAESTISLYETGKRQPDNELLIKFAEYFDVSIDYLLGRVDIKKSVCQPIEGEHTVRQYNNKINELINIVLSLSITDQDKVLDFAKFQAMQNEQGNSVTKLVARSGDKQEVVIAKNTANNLIKSNDDF